MSGRVHDADFGPGDDPLLAGSVTGVVDLGEDDDSATLGPPSDGETPDVDGSTGDDVLRLHGSGAMDVDLGAGTVDFGQGTAALVLDGFEQIAAESNRVSYLGTAGNDVIEVTGCRVDVAAGAGHDVVTVLPLMIVTEKSCRKASAVDLDLGSGDDRARSTFFFDESRVRGGRGDDVIVANGSILAGPGDDTVRGLRPQDSVERVRGGRGDDRLLGFGGDDVLRDGPGHDVARGGAGRDRCRAEVKVSCDR